jgi:hypothetical protein
MEASPLDYGFGYASANFTDDNASGSGSTSNCAISNLSVVHMNDAANAVPPPTWKESLDTLYERYQHKWLEGMVKSTEEVDRTKQVQTILQKLNHPMFNPSASWISNEIHGPINRYAIESHVKESIGMSSEHFQSTIQTLHTSYHSTVKEMFELDTSIQEKLKRVEDMHTHLSKLPTLSPTLPSTTVLQSTISHFTEQMLEAERIDKIYPKLMHTVGVFHQLRSLMKLSHSFHEPELKNPCTICMNEEIDVVMVPCGHVFCKECSKKTHTICFLCRTQVLQKQKLYF